MDIKVGEYVRTNRGIFKILEIKTVKTKMDGNHDKAYKLDKFKSLWFSKTDFIKHSSDILELIEVRDFINGLRILDLERKEDRIFACIAKIRPKEYWHTFYKEDIIDIVTKEQFEHEKYIVGE